MRAISAVVGIGRSDPRDGQPWGGGRHRARASDVARVIRVETREVDRDPRDGDARDDRVLPRRVRPKARDLCALLLLYRGSSSVCARASPKFGFYHLRSWWGNSRFQKKSTKFILNTHTDGKNVLSYAPTCRRCADQSETSSRCCTACC